MHIKRQIHFLLLPRTNGHTVRMRCSWCGNCIDFSTGFKVEQSEWNADTEHVTAVDLRTAEINRVIDEYRRDMEDIFIRYELVEKKVPSKEELKKLFNDKRGRTEKKKEEKPQTYKVTHIINLFIKKEGAKMSWTDATLTKFRTIRNLLTGFNDRLTLDQVDDDRLMKFVENLTFQRYHNTTIQKHIEFIRWFLRWAAENGYYKGNSHNTFRPRLKGANFEQHQVIYLTQDELKKLKAFVPQPGQQHLEQVRDVFLFMCFTGMRYSDAKNLKRSNIMENRIEYVPIKTSKTVSVELNTTSSAVLEKYKDKFYEDDHALPVVSNQCFNDYLKELGRICKIDTPQPQVFFIGARRYEVITPKYEVLTTHCARRTFVVSALRVGVPAEVVMRWTGHSDFKAMKPYIAIVDELKRESMTKLDSFL